MRSPAVATAAVGVALALAAATACTAATPAASPSANTPATSAVKPSTTTTPGKGAAPSTVYANDPSKPVAASVGQIVALRVDTNPSTDAGWEVASFDESKLFDMGATYDDPASAVPGRAVTQNLLFRALAPGTATVVLRYGTPGTPSPTDAQVTFTFTIS
jgi:predicted secreted protein